MSILKLLKILLGIKSERKSVVSNITNTYMLLTEMMLAEKLPDLANNLLSAAPSLNLKHGVKMLCCNSSAQ